MDFDTIVNVETGKEGFILSEVMPQKNTWYKNSSPKVCCWCWHSVETWYWRRNSIITMRTNQVLPAGNGR